MRSGVRVAAMSWIQSISSTSGQDGDTTLTCWQPTSAGWGTATTSGWGTSTAATSPTTIYPAYVQCNVATTTTAGLAYDDVQWYTIRQIGTQSIVHQIPVPTPAPNQVLEQPTRISETARDRIRKEEEEERVKQIQKANKRAEQLLKSWLSPEEYNYLQEHEELQIPSKKEPDTIYIVKKREYEMVTVRKNNEDSHRLCIHNNEGHVNDDGLLSKILLLKTDEEQFLKIANRHNLPFREQRQLIVQPY